MKYNLRNKEAKGRNLKKTTEYLFCPGNNNGAVTLDFETVSCTIYDGSPHHHGPQKLR
jgi:hypothetical protein